MKRVIFIIILVIFIFIINNLVQSIYSLWQKQELLSSARTELEKEKRVNQKLKQELAQVKDPNFVEKEARDKLLLVKPGEELVIIPPKLIAGSQSAQAKSQVVKPNWQLWLNLFLKLAFK